MWVEMSNKVHGLLKLPEWLLRTKTGLSSFKKISVRLFTSHLFVSSFLGCVNFPLQLFSFIVFPLICIDYGKI